MHVTQPTSGGVAQVVADLARVQLADGHDVAVACPGDDGFAERLGAGGIRTVTWDATRSPGRSLVSEVRALARIFSAEAPDLVHLHSSKAGLAGRLALRGRIATVFQPHAWSFEAVEGVMRSASLRWERLGARWTDRIVCVSEAERQLGGELGITARWAVVVNGVDTERFQPMPRVEVSQTPDSESSPSADSGADAGAGGSAGRSARVGAGVGTGGSAGSGGDVGVGLDTDSDADSYTGSDTDTTPDTSSVSDSDGPLVVAVGRLCRQKGQDVLLAAWPAVLSRVGAARLALVGDGPDAARLARTVGSDVRLRGVRLVGQVSDPRPWYRAADLVVLPSRWEAMALVPLEASACGRVVVASDVAGVRESLPPGRAAWAVVTPGDPRALASALADALVAAAEDPEGWARAGARAAEHARTQHDLGRAAAEISDIYINVLRERAHAGGALRHRSPERP